MSNSQPSFSLLLHQTVSRSCIRLPSSPSVKPKTCVGPQAKWLLSDKTCSFVGATLGQFKQGSELLPLRRSKNWHLESLNQQMVQIPVSSSESCACWAAHVLQSQMPKCCSLIIDLFCSDWDGMWLFPSGYGVLPDAVRAGRGYPVQTCTRTPWDHPPDLVGKAAGMSEQGSGMEMPMCWHAQLPFESLWWLSRSCHASFWRSSTSACMAAGCLSPFVLVGWGLGFPLAFLEVSTTVTLEQDGLNLKIGVYRMEAVVTPPRLSDLDHTWDYWFG